ncbi:MAG: hypothetical protein LBV80_08095 [Deltaproteobacteria bacterium]|jgi:uncharacterized membrane protein|nr:hypothetical protein [Deltaproteobacteria bacterium]
MPTDYEQQYKLQQHAERCHNYTESQKATIEFSKMSLRGAFVLNGAGAVAVLNASSLYQIETVIALFASGALCAVVAAGATYICQFFVTLTWRRFIAESINPSEAEKAYHNIGQRRTSILSDVFRVFAVLLILAAYACFGIGAYQGYKHLSIEEAQTQTMESEQTQSPGTELHDCTH